MSQSNCYEARFEIRVLFEDDEFPFGGRDPAHEADRMFRDYFDGIHEGSPLQRMYEAGREGLVAIHGRLISLSRATFTELEPKR